MLGYIFFFDSLQHRNKVKNIFFFYIFRREDEAAETSPTAVLTTKRVAQGAEEARGGAERQTIRKRKSRVRLMNLDYFVQH